MEKFTVTPWEVSGTIDYKKLIEEFGTKELDARLLAYMKILTKKEPHFMLNRRFFFSHRDFHLILNDYKERKGFFLYTGRGPSGAMHIGHLIPFLMCKWFQDVFKVNLYIQITDDEKFVQNRDRTWDDVQKQADSDILDIAAIGFDPDKTFIFKDTQFIRHAYPLMLQVGRKTTFSTAKAVFGFTNQTNLGMISYPAYQVITTFLENKRCLIPAAIDQDPYWRIQRDCAEDLGYLKTAAIHSKMLPPLTGMEGKMSSSKAETAIYLTDGPTTVKKKIMKYAFSGGGGSLEEHRKKGGNPDVDIAFQWLKALFEENDEKLEELESQYRKGTLTTGEMKNHLIKKINTFLRDHQERRKKAAPRVKKMMYTGKLAKKMWSTDFS